MKLRADYCGAFIMSPLFEDYGKTTWESKILNDFDGYKFTAEGEENSLVTIKTNSAEISFTLGELLKKEHFYTGTSYKYSHGTLHIYLEDHKWYVAKPLENETRIWGEDMKCEKGSWFGVLGAKIECGKNAEGSFILNKKSKYYKGAVRYIQSSSIGRDEAITGIANFEIKINNIVVFENNKLGIQWDGNSSHLEECYFEISKEILKEENEFEIINNDKKIHILIQMLRIFNEDREHLDIVSYPKWGNVNKPFPVKIFCEFDSVVKITMDKELSLCSPVGGIKHPKEFDDFDYEIAVSKGDNEFFFISENSGSNYSIKFNDVRANKESECIINNIWGEIIENPIPKTGIEIKTDNYSEYDYCLGKLVDEQMGNLALFRSYRKVNINLSKLWDFSVKLKKYGIYTDSINFFFPTNIIPETIADSSFGNNIGLGGHEITNIFYVGALEADEKIKSVEESERLSIEYLKRECDAKRVENRPVCLGDASGGSRYAYRTGFDILRHETYCCNHMLILPVARGSARAYKKEIWGAHVASQHCFQNEMEDAIGRFWISMILPWVFGSNFMFEEDSLFQNNKYFRMVNDDLLTRGKQIVTKDIYRHITTHQRKGEPNVSIGFIQGRYDGPFQGVSVCMTIFNIKYPNEKTRAWGKYSGTSREWGLTQCEKGWYLLDVLAPDIYLSPLNQNPYKVRKLFTSNPLGEFDMLPIEAENDVYDNYKFLFMPAWNTALKEDVEKITDYVRNGGTILISIPQLSKRIDREFISDINTDDLYNNGDFSELFGVIIKERSQNEFGEVISQGEFKNIDFNKETLLTRIPFEDENEDGSCFIVNVKITDAEVLVIDKLTNKPVLIRKRLGKGYAYLLLTCAYPGHEKLKYFMVNILKTLINKHAKCENYARDKNNDIYFSDWKHENGGKLYLINTDWTNIGNKIETDVHIGDINFKTYVFERKVKEIAYGNEIVLFSDDDVSIIAEENNKFKCCGFGEVILNVFSNNNIKVYVNDNEVDLCNNKFIICADGEFIVSIKFIGSDTKISPKKTDTKKF